MNSRMAVEALPEAWEGLRGWRSRGCSCSGRLTLRLPTLCGAVTGRMVHP